MKIKKSNIIKYGSAYLLAGSFFTFLGVKLYDSQIDHLNEYCPLNDYLGVNHQINVINNELEPRYRAYYLKSGKGKLCSDYTKDYIPEGYEVHGNKAYKNIQIGLSNAIIVTDNTVVIPMDKSEKPKYYDPKIISVIRLGRKK